MTDVVTTDILPISPSDGANARRMVRHLMADVLEWLGEDVGPEPFEETHVLQLGSTLFVSRSVAHVIHKEQFEYQPRHAAEGDQS